MREFLLSIIILSLTLLSCDDTPGNHKGKVDNGMDYYFPVDDLKEPKVYHYIPSNKNQPDLFWLISTKSSEGEEFLITDAYSIDSKGSVTHVEWLKERITLLSAYVEDYTMIYYGYQGSEIPMRSHIKSDVVFESLLEEDYGFIWSYTMSVANTEGVKEQMQRTRTYSGNAVEVDFQNEKIESLVFRDKYLINRTKYDELVETTVYNQYSYYAKNIGLIYYKRTVGEYTFEYQLNSICKIDDPKIPEAVRMRFN